MILTERSSAWPATGAADGENNTQLRQNRLK